MVLQYPWQTFTPVEFDSHPSKDTCTRLLTILQGDSSLGARLIVRLSEWYDLSSSDTDAAVQLTSSKPSNDIASNIQCENFIVLRRFEFSLQKTEDYEMNKLSKELESRRFWSLMMASHCGAGVASYTS